MLVQTYANRHPIVSCPLVWGAFSVDCFNFSSMLNNVSRDSNFLMTCWWQQRQQLCLYPPFGTSHSCFKPVCLVNWYCSIGPDHRHKFGWHVQHVDFSFVDGPNMLRHRPCHNFVWQSHNVFCGKKNNSFCTDVFSSTSSFAVSCSVEFFSLCLFYSVRYLAEDKHCSVWWSAEILMSS